MLEKLSPALKEAKVDCLVVSSLPNIRYLTGFTGSNALLVAFLDRLVFWTDPRYTLQAAREVGRDAIIAKGPLYFAVEKWLNPRKKAVIGFERETLRFDQFEVLGKQLKLKPVSGLVEKLRMVKSAAEIEKIRTAVYTNSAAFERAVQSIKSGMRESDLAAEIDYRMRRQGAEGTAFDTLVVSGERSALPHARPDRTTLREGNLVLVDMGAKQNGYTSDMTRMLHLGEPNRKTKKTYAIVREAQQSALDKVRPGATGSMIDRGARQVFETYGLADKFVHSTGHGLGLEIHEDPRIGKNGKTRMQAGMVITIEPGVYLEGWGGIRIEDTVVVTEHGCEILTLTGKDLRRI